MLVIRTFVVPDQLNGLESLKRVDENFISLHWQLKKYLRSSTAQLANETENKGNEVLRSKSSPTIINELK
jgi:hypothetical protein